MQENFLHFIWQHQYFSKENLKSTTGESINVLKTGFHNDMSGPDFSEARVEIDNLSWNGHVEIHIKSSDWDVHNHFNDPAYNNVILHVVWVEDKEVYRQDKTIPSTIELKDRVDPALLDRYEELIYNPRDILCSKSLTEVKEIVKISMVERALVSRLIRKSEQVKKVLLQNDHDWEETAYQLLASGFGFKSNSEAFFELSRILPIKLVYKHSDNLFQLEAMLFGQAGLLTGRARDAYHKSLQKEYAFLKKKYGLPENILKASIWKTGRLRPSNFPTVRISQFAAALQNLKFVFDSFLRSSASPRTLHSIFRSSPSEYWDDHFMFGEKSTRKTAVLGRESADRLIMNVVAPLLAAYSVVMDDQKYMDEAVKVLHFLKPERNSIISRWEEVQIFAKSGADSQGLIELYNSFCLKKNCLRCNIGSAILKK